MASVSLHPRLQEHCKRESRWICEPVDREECCGTVFWAWSAGSLTAHCSCGLLNKTCTELDLSAFSHAWERGSGSRGSIPFWDATAGVSGCWEEGCHCLQWYSHWWSYSSSRKKYSLSCWVLFVSERVACTKWFEEATLPRPWWLQRCCCFTALQAAHSTCKVSGELGQGEPEGSEEKRDSSLHLPIHLHTFLKLIPFLSKKLLKNNFPLNGGNSKWKSGCKK